MKTQGNDGKGYMGLEEFSGQFADIGACDFLLYFTAKDMIGDRMRMTDFYRAFASETPRAEKMLRVIAADASEQVKAAGTEYGFAGIRKHSEHFYNAYVSMRNHGANDADFRFLRK